MQKKKKIFQELIPKFPKRLMFSRSVNAWAFYFLTSKGGKGGGGGLRVNLFSSSIRCMNYVICTVLYIIMNEFCDTQKANILIC